MNCKNCGARLKDGAKVCPNCGAFLDDSDGYVLLTSDEMEYEDYYSSDKNKKPKKRNGLRWFISILLTVLIAGGGAYYYFTYIYNAVPDKPPLTFETGSGVINGDEKVIYVTIKNGSDIEYIHGVSLLPYDVNSKAEKQSALTSDYQYTKSIDSTFRTIFFDTENLELSKNGDNTFTFEMKFSFLDSNDIFTYYQVVTFESDITGDVSDIVFDHSADTDRAETTESTTAAETTTTTTTQMQELPSDDYIYNSYWYTEPYNEEDEYLIFAIKFNKDKTYSSTRYYKKGDANWSVSTYENTFVIEDGYAVLNNGEGTESSYYKMDANAKTLAEEEEGETVSKLTSRKYNSIKNAEDFFGL